MALVTASRGLGSTITDEQAKNKLKYVDLIEFHFDDGVIRRNNGAYSFNATTTTSSGTYTANGEFLSFELIKETEAAKVNEINIVVSAVSNTFSTKFLNSDYVERRVVIYRQFFDSSNSTVGTPVMLFDGEMKNFNLNETLETSTIAVKSASVFYNFEDSNGRRTTDSSQQQIFAGDKGMEFASTTVKEIRWGRPDVS